ncbi:hypothetical protein EJB05_38320, partial [Eragrostis curvula]
MASRAFAALFTVLALVCFASVPRALATDPTQLQDICVAADTNNPAILVNGFVCKNPKLATANDFFFHIVPATPNAQGVGVAAVDVTKIPGLNTLGISLARLDFVPGGQNPPHTHPRATEILVVVQGQLLVGFVLSNQLNNTLITKQLVAGDVFVFPQGLIHFQLNNGKMPALAFAGLSSQFPGVITIANSVFATKPPISDEILAKAFMIEKDQVDWIQSQFAMPPPAGGGGMAGGGGGGYPGNGTGGGFPGNGTGGGYPGYP